MDAFTQVTPGTPFLILFVISLFVKLEHHFKCLKKRGKKNKIQEINQKLKEFNYKANPSFYDALSMNDKKLLMQKEVLL